MSTEVRRCCYKGWNTFGRTHEDGCGATARPTHPPLAAEPDVHQLVGKTIAAVTEKDVVLTDTYDDKYTVTQTTLTFTDGTTQMYGDIQMDLYD